MTRLYCPECSEYLEGGDGECHDCSCGWKQPVETFEEDVNTLKVAYDELCEELEDSQRQLEVAAEFCRQYQIENKQLKAESDADNETNLQLNLEIMTLKAENKKLGDYYMKMNDMYWNDEIFEVNHGEGFYTDKFVEVVADL